MRLALLLSALFGFVTAAPVVAAAERPPWKVVNKTNVTAMPEDLYQAILSSAVATHFSGQVSQLAAPPPADAWDPMIWVDADTPMPLPPPYSNTPPMIEGKSVTRLIWSVRLAGYEVMAWEHLYGFVGARRVGESKLVWVTSTDRSADGVNGFRTWESFRAVAAIATPPNLRLEFPKRMINLSGLPDALYRRILNTGSNPTMIRRVRDLPAPLSGRPWADVGDPVSSGDVIDPGRPFREALLWAYRLDDYLLVAWSSYTISSETYVEAYKVSDPGKLIWSVYYPASGHWDSLAAFKADVAIAPKPDAVLPVCGPMQAISDQDAYAILLQRPIETFAAGAKLPSSVDEKLALVSSPEPWRWAVRLTTNFAIQYPGRRLVLVPYGTTDWDKYWMMNEPRQLTLDAPDFSALQAMLLPPTLQKFAQGGCLGSDLRLSGPRD